jgi:hypothetical protein
VAGNASPHPRVEVVEAGGLDGDAHLARPRLGDLTVFKEQLVVAAVLSNHHCAHNTPPGMGVGV